MATVYGTNYTAAYVTTPCQGVAASDGGGRVGAIYDSYTTDGSETVGSTITLGTKIPAGARILDTALDHGAMGTSTTLALDINSVNFIAAASTSTAAIKYRGQGLGIGTKLATSASVVLTVAGATLTAARDIKVYVLYQID